MHPGEIFASKYRVERLLGMGGMGVVMAAAHLQLDHKVAIKYLRPEALDRQDSLERFLREARVAAALRSEHIARVIDYGTSDEGVPYIVMEHLDGSDLAAVVSERGPLPVTEAVDYLLQACEALAEAHSLGLVHRDIKPGNFFLTARADGSPLVKVLDFGISKAPETEDLRLTSTTEVIGSPYYMSPEQLLSARNVDHRTDIWSLGVVLYELVCGRPPWTATKISQLSILIATRMPDPVSAGVPPDLERIIERCMSKDPDGRYNSIAELAADLAPLASPEQQASVGRIARVLERTPVPRMSTGPGSTAPVPARPPLSTNETALVQPMLAPTGHRTGARRWMWTAVATVVVLATIAIVLAMQDGSRQARSSQPLAAPNVAPVDAAVATSAIADHAEEAGDAAAAGPAPVHPSQTITATIDAGMVEAPARTERNRLRRQRRIKRQPTGKPDDSERDPYRSRH